MKPCVLALDVLPSVRGCHGRTVDPGHWRGVLCSHLAGRLVASPSRGSLGGLMSTASARSEIPAATVVLHVGRQFRASEKAVVEAALGPHPGVVSVEANPVAQTATVRYDPAVTSVQELRRVIERSGFECAGCN